jgi:hypothetical protein
MHLWDRFIPHAVITLYMLRSSRINTKLSTSMHLDGQYDYNRDPMAPPGTIIIACETPNRRRTWAPRGQDGWYIGPDLEHYRCYTLYTKTRSEGIVVTVELFSTEVEMSFQSSQDLVTQADKQMTPAGPFTQVGDDQMLTLKQLSAIFEGALPSHKSNMMSPQVKIADSDTTLRVQITVAPLMVQRAATPVRVVQPPVTHDTMSNSHRRLQPTPCRAVIPSTPHPMVRRSAPPHNLSSDMLAETVQQENHVFLIAHWAHHKNSKTCHH